jgi:hypothetical protein
MRQHKTKRSDMERDDIKSKIRKERRDLYTFLTKLIVSLFRNYFVNLSIYLSIYTHAAAVAFSLLFLLCVWKLKNECDES